jgi:hypothetical protein
VERWKRRVERLTSSVEKWKGDTVEWTSGKVEK